MDRRAFVNRAAGVSLGLATAPWQRLPGAPGPEGSGPLTLLLCGDVMTGRGIDQVLPHPGDPRLFEPFARSARDYVALAEAKNGPIPQPVDYAYPWGDALAELGRAAPDVTIVNLETSVTASDDRWMGKGIHYRMHPENVPCLLAAGIDCCALANNHTLDWGRTGLAETIGTLRRAGIATAGVGRDLAEAAAPAVLAAGGKGRVLVFAFGLQDSGIAEGWAAAERRPGVRLLPELSTETVRQVGQQVSRLKRQGDVAVASIHWGGNWGYPVPVEQRAFAHGLIDEAGVDVVHGHSSHHPKGIEVYRGRPILYGCGDFLSDYEGIGGYERFRGELALAYLVTVDPGDGRLVRLRMLAFRIRRFRLNRASPTDAHWLSDTLSREGRPLGTVAEPGPDDTLVLRWD